MQAMPRRMRRIANNELRPLFFRPEGASPCECERSTDANLAQILHLMMSREVEGKIAGGNARPARLLADAKLSDEERISELYLWAFARFPSDDERKFSLAFLAKKQNKRQAFEDILWAMLNSKEFSFVR
jgi:hypothetical protein